MSVFAGSSGASSGLEFAYDMYNPKSYVGAPATNLLPTPAINSVPTTGNGWGTYNTNQYGSGAYFSIGTVSSVSGNIVTMTAAHSLRSYDVMQPQGSGGGVTGGTNYLIKKLSATTFSLHAYNSSQDGSQGYINPATGTHKVYDDFANDVKISINSTSFPTMWWGYPHLPNSGCVKEVRTNGCSIPGFPTTDCLRIYHTRPDGVTDGMAYGVDTPVTPGVAHTVSFWTKTVNSAAVGQSISYQIYNYAGGSAVGFSFSATLGAVGVWVKQSLTFTPTYSTCISYFFPSSGNIIYDLAHIQFETGSVATDWTSSSRSTSQALLDLTSKNTITATSISYTNSKSFTFDGSYSYLQSPRNCGITGDVTLTAWIKPNRTGQTGPHSTVICTDVNYPYGAKLMNFKNSARYGIWLGWAGGGNTNFEAFVAADINDNTNKMLTASWTQSTGIAKIYLNGILQSTQSTGITSAVALVDGKITVGTDYNNISSGTLNKYLGIIYGGAVYSRALSDSEVLNLFNASRGRYGI
jgi:hypothetical protein